MFTRRKILIFMSLIMIAAMSFAMTACKTDDVSKSAEDDVLRRADNEEKLLKAMTEYPGEGLYYPAMTEIGLDASAPTEGELAEEKKKAANEKDVWQKAVGDCFADGMFDTFYSEWERTHIMGAAWIYELETEMTGFNIEDDASHGSDNIEHAIITVTATDRSRNTLSFNMDWRVIFDSKNPDLIQKIELIDDGGFLEAYLED